MRLGVGLTLFLAVTAAAWAGGRATPRVSITSLSPVVVKGSGFRAHERVTVTVTAKESRMRKVTATARGAFVVRFADFSIERCVAYGVKAVGNRGSAASFKLTPECAPLAPAGETTTEPAPLTPTDPVPKQKP